jgi:hypothetical protein
MVFYGGEIIMQDQAISPRVTKVISAARRFTAKERLVLAKLLLDSLVVDEVEDKVDWLKMSLTAFEQDWDNPDDAIYDQWRELYGVPAR